MKWHQIKLENIGCFENKTIDFSQLSVIYGENRTGKSTLVYALFFALFGKHLNPNLRVKDLCRKGCKRGRADLHFTRQGAGFHLRQHTDGLPHLTDAAQTPINLNDPEAIRAYIPIAPEIASLSSFFRENEILFFLQDVPKYNQTLLQHLIGFDSALILRSRFKKALAKAQEARRMILNAAPKKPDDPLNIALLKQQLAETEKEFQQVVKECSSSAGNNVKDPTVYQLLHKQFEEKKANILRLEAMKDKLPSQAETVSKREQLEKQLSADADTSENTNLLQQEMGALAQEKSHIRARLERIQELETGTHCLLCEQPVSKVHLKSLKKNLSKDAEQIKTKRLAIETRLNKIKKQQNEQMVLKKQLDQLSVQLQERIRIEEQIKGIREQQEKLAADLKEFESVRGDLKEAETGYCRQETLNSRRNQLQEKIVEYKVKLTNHDDHHKRSRDHQKHMAAAERNILICRCAFQAMDNAIQSLGSRLTQRIRESLKTWRSHFSFLQHFDIHLDEGELLPMIQARGYQYKLNQMSKSERIFLYLMLKLAIGDALGHSGVFVLDDPADGLDLKRKETLAYLLSEVSRKRQVIVTTNDAVFADMFRQAHRVNL